MKRKEADRSVIEPSCTLFKPNKIYFLPSNRVLDRKPDRVTGYKVLFDLTSLIYIYMYIISSKSCENTTSSNMSWIFMLIIWIHYFIHHIPKNRCVSDRPTLTFFMPKKNRSAKSRNSSPFPCLFLTSTIFFISLYIWSMFWTSTHVKQLISCSKKERNKLVWF